MTVSKRDLFEQLEPPAGGQQALRERLRVDSQRRRRIATRVAGFTAVTATAAIMLVWFALGAPSPAAERTHTPPPAADILDGQRHAHPALAEAAPDEPVSVRGDKQHQYAVQRVDAGDKQVVFYMVSSRTSPAEPKPR